MSFLRTISIFKTLGFFLCFDSAMDKDSDKITYFVAKKITILPLNLLKLSIFLKTGVI